ncbi:helix-turn-helix domain-containing protein [Amycolatopsis jejuensis]|uniref:helix-turn-helix domain-containing protein n=1 Tax=Amycolatopsis jejuensis TaxID=330084 RepID=UPI0005249A73|nr:helix-turn-helix transcriptional regulator [Amycolatopsis jejuensis]
MNEDPNVRLLEFADGLRQRRIAHAPVTTQKALAELLGWREMKVSLIERGKQAITEPELTEWTRVLGVPAKELDALQQELKAIRLDQARWKARLRTSGHEGAQKSFAELEHAAQKIVDVETAIVPGPVQTPAYARVAFEKLARFKGAGGDVAAAVAARMQRQQILYDETKTIELLMFEAALHSRFVPPETMAGQIDRLIAVTHLRNVRVGIVPLDAELEFPPLHGFWLFDDELLSAEAIHTDIVTRDSEDVQLYCDYVAALWKVAAEGDDAREILNRRVRAHAL